MERNRLFALILLLFSSLAFATEPKLVLDAPNAYEMPRNFRVFSTCSASAQFSEKELLIILQFIPSDSITVVDLREEPHGFIAGDAISWYSLYNSYGMGYSTREIEALQEESLKRLNGKKRVSLYIREGEESFLPSMIPGGRAYSERALCKQMHLGYARFYTADHHYPADFVVDAFVNFILKQRKGEWLHYHCLGGDGRTTLFLVMQECILHGKDRSLEEILREQEAKLGTPLLRMPSKNSWKYIPFRERAAFLVQFYEYCKKNSDNFTTPWSEWKRNLAENGAF